MSAPSGSMRIILCVFTMMKKMQSMFLMTVALSITPDLTLPRNANGIISFISFLLRNIDIVEILNRDYTFLCLILVKKEMNE